MFNEAEQSQTSLDKAHTGETIGHDEMVYLRRALSLSVRSGKRKNLSSKELLRRRSVTFEAESQFCHFRQFAAVIKEEQNPFCLMNLGCQKIKTLQ